MRSPPADDYDRHLRQERAKHPTVRFEVQLVYLADHYDLTVEEYVYRHFPHLSDREARVLIMRANRATYREIAASLGVCPSTARNILLRLSRKISQTFLG